MPRAMPGKHPKLLALRFLDPFERQPLGHFQPRDISLDQRRHPPAPAAARRRWGSSCGGCRTVRALCKRGGRRTRGGQSRGSQLNPNPVAPAKAGVQLTVLHRTPRLLMRVGPGRRLFEV